MSTSIPAITPSSCWLITGASGGLGLALSLAALERGKKVLAATRDPVRAAAEHPELERAGGIWMALDVNEPAAREIVARAVEEHGVDVLVNNAAVAMLGAFEDMTDEEYASTFNPNVFAAQRTIRGALPALRARGRGTLVNVGSAAGFWGNPSRAAYAATKHALGGLSDALARELAPFGLRVLLVEPGAFRTGFAGAALSPAAARHGNGNVSAAYVGSEADKVVAYTRTLSAEAPGDPAKAAHVVLDAVDGTGWAAGAQPFVRLPLGRDAVELMKRKIALLQAELEIVQAAAAATNFDVV